jgi:predicted PurR-regulated permease PerM
MLVLAGLWLFILAVAILFRDEMVSFAAAALIAYLVQPAVGRITQFKVRGQNIPRWVAILLIYAVFLLVVYLFFVLLVPQLYRELVRVTRDAGGFLNSLTPERVRELSVRAEEWLNDHGVPVLLSNRSLEGDFTPATPAGNGSFSMTFDLQEALGSAVSRASKLLEENFTDIVTVSRHVITGVVAWVFGLFFMLMVAAFFSIDASLIRSYAKTLIPPEMVDQASALVHRMDMSLSGVVRGQFIICLVNGTLTFLGLLLFGVKFAFLLATIATIASIIPIFGTFLSSVPICMLATAQSLKAGIGMLLWIVGIHALEAYVLNPKIMGSSARIHPVVIAFALIAGERTFGLLGALFAAPVVALVAACFDFARLKAQPPQPIKVDVPAS